MHATVARFNRRRRIQITNCTTILHCSFVSWSSHLFLVLLFRELDNLCVDSATWIGDAVWHRNELHVKTNGTLYLLLSLFPSFDISIANALVLGWTRQSTSMPANKLQQLTVNFGLNVWQFGVRLCTGEIMMENIFNDGVWQIVAHNRTGFNPSIKIIMFRTIRLQHVHRNQQKWKSSAFVLAWRFSMKIHLHLEPKPWSCQEMSVAAIRSDGMTRCSVTVHVNITVDVEDCVTFRHTSRKIVSTSHYHRGWTSSRMACASGTSNVVWDGLDEFVDDIGLGVDADSAGHVTWGIYWCLRRQLADNQEEESLGDVPYQFFDPIMIVLIMLLSCRREVDDKTVCWLTVVVVRYRDHYDSMCRLIVVLLSWWWW